MEARLISAAMIAAALLSTAAGYRTQNFIVSAPSGQLAREIGDAAETYRRQLALEWLGKELPRWQDPCPITVQVGSHLGAGGATSFYFDQGRPHGWTMSIQGSRERLLDSVLPHEVTHTIFATHFGQPLPRWADEGACTTVEHDSEKNKQKQMLVTFLTTGRGIAFNRMFAMKEYPRDIMPLYSQGYSLARYLIAQGGKQKFVRYVGDGMDSNNWTAATQKHYGFQSLSELQVTWLNWVRRGCPPLVDNSPALAKGPARVTPITSFVSRDDTPPASNRTGVNASPASNQLTPVPPLGRSAVARADTPVAGESSDGWYSRHRPRPPATQDASRLANVASPRTIAPAATQPPMQSVTRPQPMGRPRQAILEWSRTPASSQPMRTAPPATGSYYASPPPSGTKMWR